jgi:formate dehydrogenase major subunit
MDPTRRQFLKASTLGGVAASVLGFDLAPALAQGRALKIARTTETRSTCPYCSVSCGVIIHTLGDRSRNVMPTVVHVEGDPDHPINQGTLCPKGITLKQNIVNDRRLTKVMYRAPGTRAWQEKTWDWAIERIARLVKETRDRHLIESEPQNRALHALTALGVIGERGQLSAGEGLPRRARGHTHRAAGPYLTRPHGGQSGRHVRTRRDDQRVDRHPERGCHPRDGWESG